MPPSGIDPVTPLETRKREIAALHRQFGGVLYDFCVRLLHDRAEAEDALQEVFLNAYRAYDSFTFGESRLPWLYRIASNTCFKIMRTRRRKGPVLTFDTDRKASPEAHPADTLDARRLLEKLVSNLDERGFEILVCHYLSGMTQDEIASSLGISRRAVVKRLTALRKQAGSLKEEI